MDLLLRLRQIVEPAKMRWIISQIALGIGDIALTPWHNLDLEANPIIRGLGILPMLGFKALGILWFIYSWNRWDNEKFRMWLGIATGILPAVAIVSNVLRIMILGGDLWPSLPMR